MFRDDRDLVSRAAEYLAREALGAMYARVVRNLPNRSSARTGAVRSATYRRRHPDRLHMERKR
jgi:hypothetical protein